MRRTAGLTAAAFLVSISAIAQTGAQSTGEQAKAKHSVTSNSMTVVGCLMKEADYRKAHGLGKSALNNAGLGDEFVLVDATAATAVAGSETPSETGSAPASAPSTSAACSEQGSGTAYRLTGKAEKGLTALVGHRIEVTGRWDHARDARTAAGQTHAKLPPEIAIASYREAPAAVVAMPAAPAPAATTGSEPPAPAPPAPTVEPKPLPKTASNQPLFALVSLLLFSAAIGVRALRRRASES